MIVPSLRLLVWTALVVLPAAVLGGVFPEMLAVAVGIVVLFAVLAALDAVLGLSAMEGIEVKLPDVVRLSKDRDGVIEIQLKNDQQKPRQLRVGLPFPREITTPDETMDIQVPAKAIWSRVDWPCRPLRRGNYPLDKCHIETFSPFGLWAVRAAAAVRSELRVYPNLLGERKAAALFLNRGSLGTHAQRQVGKGRDFEQLRDYIPGDGSDDIHWKATAKRGHPVTKIFQIERTQEVYVLIDASRLSARLTTAPGAAPRPGAARAIATPRHESPSAAEPISSVTVLERFITAGLVLGLAAEQHGDLFGLLTFSDRIGSFVRAKNGQSHYNLCRDAIYALHPQPVTPDFDELASFVRLRLRRRALLVILTSLDDPVLAESFVRNMDIICRQHVILVNMMPPPEIAPLFSTAAEGDVNDLYRRLGGHILWNNLRELEKTLQRRGVRFSLVRNENLSAELITQYLAIKQRQLI